MSGPDPAILRSRLGEALRRLREGRSLTRSEVAHRMGEGPSFTGELARWERGEDSPPAYRLWAYLLAVDASFTDLGYEVDTAPDDPRLREIASELDALAPARA